MSKVCVECGFSVPVVEPPVPLSPTAGSPEVPEPNKCPNCGKLNVMEEVADLPGGEEEEE